MTNTAIAPVTDFEVDPNCIVCLGTGEDQAFGGSCSECSTYRGTERIPTTVEQHVNPNDKDLRHYQPGDRLDGRTFGTSHQPATDKQLRFLRKLIAEHQPVNAESLLTEITFYNKATASVAIDGFVSGEFIAPAPQQPAPVPQQRGPVATDKQLRFIRTLLAERAGDEIDRITAKLEHTLPTKTQASQLIDNLIAMPKAEQGPAEPTPAVDLGLDLTPLEQYTSNSLVRFGIPGADTRLKVRIKFARNGTIYVDDAAEYGHGRSYGKQRPGSSYQGDITDELTAILADPQAAALRYCELTDHCAVCNRKLEHEDSVNRGVGPVCAQKLGLV